MAKLEITIPDDKINRVLDSITALHPIPLKDDPDNVGEQIPEFTKAVWVKKIVIHFLKSQIARADLKAAQANITVDIDLT
jgi:hypothetical protein